MKKQHHNQLTKTHNNESRQLEGDFEINNSNGNTFDQIFAV